MFGEVGGIVVGRVRCLAHQFRLDGSFAKRDVEIRSPGHERSENEIAEYAE